MKDPIVIFGGAGFIGRALTLAFKELDLPTVCADNEWIEPESPSPADEVVKCDVRSPAAIRKVLNEYEPSTIYWLPAQQGYGHNLVKFAKIQLVGTYGLFQAIDAPGVRRPDRIILSSSQAVYDPGVLRTVDRSPADDPPSVYGWSKLQQERAFIWFCKDRGIVCTALRYSIVLGAGQALQSTESGVIRNWYHAWRIGKSAQIYGDGTQVRDFVHVKHVSKINVRMLEHKLSGIYNVGGPAIMINDLFSIWQRLTDCKNAKVLGRDVRPGGEYSLTGDGPLCDHGKYQHGIEEMIVDFLDGIDGKVPNTRRQHSEPC